jgi:hypothetical protein
MATPTPIFIDLENKPLDQKRLKKMAFVMNALERGWTVKKRDQEYIFTKKHENRREVFRENYLETFVQENFDLSIFNRKDHS